MRRLVRREPLVPSLQTKVCPIHATLGVLGRKWALQVLRDTAFFKNARFSDMLRNNPGLTPRILSMRLKELQREGFVRRFESNRKFREIVYDLTPKGWDSVPILTAFLSFGMKYHAGKVFEDGKVRTLGQYFPGCQHQLLGALEEYARSA